MALNLSGIVEYGRLINDNEKSTHGWLKLRGDESGHMIGLTGDLGPDLRGKTIAFWPNPDLPVDHDSPETKVDASSVHPHQVGPTGKMTAAEWVDVADSAPPPIYGTNEPGSIISHRRRCLHLEWFSQNGRVVIELVDPLMEEMVATDDEKEWVALPPGPEPEQPENNQPPAFDPVSAAREAIPYGHPYKAPRFDGSLFSDNDDDASVQADAFDSQDKAIGDQDAASDINSYLENLSAEADKAAGLGKDADITDDEFLREMEYMDEIVEGKHDDDAPINSILTIGDIEQLTEEQAEAKLKEVLAILALHGIAIHICKHFSSKDTLRLIRDDYGVESRIHPGLIGSGWTTNFNTAESCPACDAEWDEEHKDLLEQWDREKAANGNNEASDYTPDSDLPF